MKLIMLKIFTTLYLSASFQPMPMPAECGAAAGCAQPPRVWIDPQYDHYGAAVHNHIVYHEMGHLFDVRYMTPAARRAFSLVIGDDRPWRDSTPNPPNEKFAEAVARCFDGRYNAAVNRVYEYLPSFDQYTRICRLIEAVYTGQPRVV